jgi:tetratricopeptide (TPR) repeat protein
MRSGIDPLFRRALADLALRDPELQLFHFYSITGEEIALQIERVLEEDPDLEKWNPVQKRRLFGQWNRFGDREKLAAELLARPGWQESGWLTLAEIHAAKGDYRLALDIASAHLESPAAPRLVDRRPIEDLRTAFTLNETDVSAGLRLYNAESVQDNREAALAALEKVALLPGCPDYAYYLLSKEREKAGRLEDAWQSLSHYFSKQPPP